MAQFGLGQDYSLAMGEQVSYDLLLEMIVHISLI